MVDLPSGGERTGLADAPSVLIDESEPPLDERTRTTVVRHPDAEAATHRHPGLGGRDDLQFPADVRALGTAPVVRAIASAGSQFEHTTNEAFCGSAERNTAVRNALTVSSGVSEGALLDLAKQVEAAGRERHENPERAKTRGIRPACLAGEAVSLTPEG